MPKLTVIINAWKEPEQIVKAISCILDSAYSGIIEDFELIQVCPDDETLHAALTTVEKFGLTKKFVQIKDPQKGKPYGLKMALDAAKGEIVIMTDADVYFGPNTIAELMRPFNNPKVGGVTGRPISADSRNSMMGYFGHLLADAADHKRRHVATYHEVEDYYEFSTTFFPMSGYIYAIRKFEVDFPANALVEDAYISHLVFNRNDTIVYNPKATVFVKYPSTLSDYFKQKVRSLGGFSQLLSMGVVKKGTATRTFTDELKYAFFPLFYARSPKELLWSLALYPIRLWTWVKIRSQVKKIANVLGKSEGWQRIESTK